MTLLLLGLLCAALHWLIARSTIAKPFWSRTTGKLDELLRCPACSGFWLGLGLWLLGIRPLGNGIVSCLLSPTLGAILTPVFETALLWGLAHTAIEEREAEKPMVFDSCAAADAIMRQLKIDRPDVSIEEISRFRGTIHRAFGWEKTDDNEPRPGCRDG